MPDHVEQALDSDAPLTAAVHQRDVAHEVSEAEGWKRAAISGRTVTINRPRDEVYAAWRDFRNLGLFMEHIVSVEPLDDGRSHWIVKAPAGRTVEWDAVLTEDEPGERLAWRSVEDADIKSTGVVEFRDGPPGRGTELTATIAYEPTGGDIGKLIAKLFQEEPKLQARRDLRRFKQWMETGEISTSRAPDAAPRG